MLAACRLLCLLTLFFSVLAQHALSLERRDALSDSGLSSASWIWLPEPDLLTTAPTGTVALVKTLTTPTGKSAYFASIAMTVDNNFTLWVNGQPVGASDGTVANVWETAQVFTAALNSTANVFSVLGSNTGTVTPNPAGLLAAIRVFFTDSTNETVFSDNTWVVSGTIPSDFPLSADLSSFVQAEVATTEGSGPWGTSLTLPASATPPTLTGSAWICCGERWIPETVTSPSGKTATSATILVTADNTFQLFVNGQYIGSPPYDNNESGTTGSWEFAQLFTDVALTPTSNVFTIFATNFAAQTTTGGPSSAGMVAALQITFSDGSSEVVRTDTTWLAGNYSSVSTFLSAPDGALAPAISSGLFGIAPWGTLLANSNALNNLKLPANNAAVVEPTTTSTKASSSTSNALIAPTTILPNDPIPSTTTNVTTGGARARNGHIPLALVLGLPIISLTVL
ncbi:hypothetical protein MSAN_01763900 [Mycena sanguinolenta]|uniref:Uncharacterized protein n=1 Tax=Mycena sanguinolenta TaxID=230812 RepID=A0A8H6XV39_9AGAR|nr:hypothetical protein MSAN_01763900 [Mycena sanguinolenta]